MSVSRQAGGVLRQCLSAQVLSSGLYRAELKLKPLRPDIQLQQELAQQTTQQLGTLLSQHRGRPSLLNPVLRSAGAFVGAVAALSPGSIGATINAAAVDALADAYDAQLRELHESGQAADAHDVRNAIKHCRDTLPTIPGAVKVPDLIAMQQQGGLNSLTPLQGLGAAVKLSLGSLLRASARI